MALPMAVPGKLLEAWALTEDLGDVGPGDRIAGLPATSLVAPACSMDRDGQVVALRGRADGGEGECCKRQPCCDAVAAVGTAACVRMATGPGLEELAVGGAHEGCCHNYVGLARVRTHHTTVLSRDAGDVGACAAACAAACAVERIAAAAGSHSRAPLTEEGMRCEYTAVCPLEDQLDISQSLSGDVHVE